MWSLDLITLLLVVLLPSLSNNGGLLPPVTEAVAIPTLPTMEEFKS